MTSLTSETPRERRQREARERIQWYVRRTRLAFDALETEFKERLESPTWLLACAVAIACADGIVDGLDDIDISVRRLERNE